ncbi:MAG TPA: septation protein IspZ [Rhizomicrobium sp.]|jgi:intracellular septation protein A
MYFLRALRPLASDFLSTIVFVAFYAITGSIRAGVMLGIAVGVGQIAYIFWRGKRPDIMQWASLALVVVLGSASLITRDPRFIMVKPSIAAFAIACVMLKPNWMGRYLPPIVTDNVSPAITTAWGYAWSGLLFLTAAANIYVALTCSPATWAWFISLVPLSTKLALFLAQYATLHFLVSRNIRARLTAGSLSAAE